MGGKQHEQLRLTLFFMVEQLHAELLVSSWVVDELIASEQLQTSFQVLTGVVIVTLVQEHVWFEQGVGTTTSLGLQHEQLRVLLGRVVQLHTEEFI
jgi:hypothetical protein